MLYSPLNYPGNKSRIVDLLLALVPKDVTDIREIFCGSAVFSLASRAERVFLNDIDRHITELIMYFYNNQAEEIIARADNIIAEYGLTNTYYEGKDKYPETKHEGLSRYNKSAYNRLKADYNQKKDIAKLFVLLIYGFNHYLRFNSKGEFNVPVGKVDFVKTLRQKTINYCNAAKSKQLFVTNLDFRNQTHYDCNNAALFYFDPPYLITQAPYNLSWTEKDERDLLEIIDDLDTKGCRFMLSNVVESNGRRNDILVEWMQKYRVKHIHRQYLNSSYQKKNIGLADEVIIYNYGEE